MPPPPTAKETLATPRKHSPIKLFIATTVILSVFSLYIREVSDSLFQLNLASNNDKKLSVLEFFDAAVLQEGLKKKADRKIQELRSDLSKGMIESPDAIVNRTRAHQGKNIFPCRYVFLDFGSNVGDTLDNFVTSGMVSRKSMEENSQKMEKFSIYRFVHRSIGEFTNTNFADSGADRLHEPVLSSSPVKPEDYCFYGVEGNPIFTPKLQEKEIDFLNSEPRFVKHVHFLTEHIGTNQDGPSTLYLDTVNKNKNYWGSSVYPTHQDVKKSGGVNSSVPVMGITLATLLEKTVQRDEVNSGNTTNVRVFSDRKRAKKSHVMIKVDIEGGEYILLLGALHSNILCELDRQGVMIHMLVESHGPMIIGSIKPLRRWKNKNGWERIRECGVHLYTGDAGRRL